MFVSKGRSCTPGAMQRHGTILTDNSCRNSCVSATRVGCVRLCPELPDDVVELELYKKISTFDWAGLIRNTFSS